MVISKNNYEIELLGKACTIIMLLSIGILTGGNSAKNCSLSLRIWRMGHIFFIALKILIHWPASFFT